MMIRASGIFATMFSATNKGLRGAVTNGSVGRAAVPIDCTLFRRQLPGADWRIMS